MARIRVSIGNLAVGMRTGSGYAVPIGFLNPKKLARGEKEYGALGGAAQLTDAGVMALDKSFGAEGFELDRKTGLHDARFTVDETELDNVFRFFCQIAGKKTRYELDPSADIRDELSGREFPDMPPILSVQETADVVVEYVRSVRQKPPAEGAGTSVRAAGSSLPTRRLFRCYTLVLSEIMFGKMAQSQAIRVLSERELATTYGGSQKGRTFDGAAIADNLFLA